MKNDISVVVSMLCERTPKTLSVIQESFNVFVALSGFPVEEIMMDKNLLDALNRYVNNDLVDEMGLEYGSELINLVYNK
ncbi:hypothetical protein ACLLS5_000563 [Salmonella enterica]|uniref:Uncharacterized protein n=1 Tax=Salmonella enterica subsp. arizonae TaxID=59203 RepID=A0A379TAM9_SALER|nr:hypothetical protein [Salmonella enterica]EAN8394029.1 hypothetical protein [Salmonella enterica subsp. arizonae serovar 13,23:gz51:-]EBF3615483.1 hypothetical protein [Salmonella enterica subsp. arizonae serovar [1],13,23:g,z51:-]EBR4052517.1 hypothetical protein [Salmonella enterica subsp. enterica]ECL5967795.1 hypothetical protein [Salmonella enterica subsp. enterica serovar [1],13,23:g,z51:-]ECU8519599.1 hypothetical protein [Salmonella enterica subsp. arizonae serovar 44:z4,z23,z32:-]